MTTALVIDDHPVTHLGCRNLLAEAGYTEVRDARDGPAALRALDRGAPDLIILDLGLPGVGGLQLIAQLKRRAPDCPILIFSMNDGAAFAARALEAGALGYLSKHAPPEDFLAAVKSVAAGRAWLDRDMAIDIATLRASGGDAPMYSLTPREHQVLRLLGQGLRHDQIAERLNVSYKTVANACAATKKKLNAGSLAELIRISVEMGCE